MHKSSLASVVFSFFVSPERADEMEGDLIEQSRVRGALWYWFQVALVALALLLRALAKAPISISLIGVAGFAALYAGVLAGELLSLSPVGSYLSTEAGLSTIPFRIAMLCLTAAPVSFLAGFALVRFAPRRGATAVVLALFLFGGFLTVLQISVYPPALIASNILKMAFAGLPLLLGGIVAHKGRLRGDRAT